MEIFFVMSKLLSSMICDRPLFSSMQYEYLNHETETAPRARTYARPCFHVLKKGSTAGRASENLCRHPLPSPDHPHDPLGVNLGHQALSPVRYRRRHGHLQLGPHHAANAQLGPTLPAARLDLSVNLIPECECEC